MTIIATRTLRAFEDSVFADQGNQFRMWLGRVLPHMSDAYRQDNELFRSHMGASTIGRDCAREVWFSFRWATERKAEGRMLRLWNRGHLEEARFIALLLSIGCEVFQQDADGKQFRISELGGHYGGSGDGVFKGCPDLEVGLPALSEFKTHNDKSFKKLAGDNWDAWFDYHVMGLTKGVRVPPQFKGEGVRSAKPEHYIQMQQYMRKMGLAVGVYFAVDKDNDHIYAEVVPLDTETADKYLGRAISIVQLPAPPKRISDSPGWFGCKFCDHRMVCHFGAAPAKNCRTCEWSTPVPDGTWRCDQPDNVSANGGQPLTLNKARQLEGCGNWAKHSKAFV